MANNLTENFLESVKGDNNFKEVIEIIYNNIIGNCWLIGGYVYRSIASEMYGIEKPKTDLDFIVEGLNKKINLPDSWGKGLNKYGNPKIFRTDGLEVDLIPLQNVSSIIRRRLPNTIDNFLTGTPLSIQSIVYDIKNNQVQGEIGMKALLEKKVTVNNIDQAKIYSNLKDKSIDKIIQEKALSLGFEPIFLK